MRGLWMRLLLVCVCVVGGVRPGEGAAEGWYNGDYLPVGMALGWTSPGGKNGSPDAHEGGFTLGVEASYAHVWDEALWYGGYFDALITPNDEEVRLSFGPEFGALIIGVDAGPLIRVASGDVNVGMQIRGLLTITSLFMPYVRGGFFFDDSPSFFEAGLLSKFPIEL